MISKPCYNGKLYRNVIITMIIIFFNKTVTSYIQTKQGFVDFNTNNMPAPIYIYYIPTIRSFVIEYN